MLINNENFFETNLTWNNFTTNINSLIAPGGMLLITTFDGDRIADLLKDKNIDNRIKEVCLFHHEKCDGSGYPFGLKSDKIPLMAKIVTVADVYDAMTAARVYRGSMCPFDVIKIMEDESFSKYDPNVLLPFINHVVSSYLHTNVRLSDGRIGEVVLINSNRLSRPSIMCSGEFIDLSKRPDLSINAIL